jgi:hypothetical protein
MAEQEVIDAVRLLLGPESVAEGWTDEKIGAMLDAGQDSEDVALGYWEFKAARTTTLVNVSESGSSRSLGDIHKNSLKMVEYYRGLKNKEDAVETRVVTSTRPIRRV